MKEKNRQVMDCEVNSREWARTLSHSEKHENKFDCLGFTRDI